MSTHLQPTEQWKGSLSNPSTPQSGSAEAVFIELQQVIGRKWHLVIVYNLLNHGPSGFNDLKSSVDGISGKVLSDALSDLTDLGLINRTVVSTKPFRVQYDLTPAGRSLEPLLAVMYEWGEQHVAEGWNQSMN